MFEKRKDSLIQSDAELEAQASTKSTSDGQNIKKLTQRILQEAGAIDTPIDIIKTCRQLSIDVYATNLDKLEEQTGLLISGVSELRPGREWVIYVNERYSHGHMRFSTAHELAHYYLHKEKLVKGIMASFKRDAAPHELEANRFAEELLMPEKLVREEHKKMVIPVCDTLVQKFKVTKEAMQHRLKDLGLMYI